MLCIILLTNLLSLSKVASLHTGVYNYPLINVQGAVFSKELDW